MAAGEWHGVHELSHWGSPIRSLQMLESRVKEEAVLRSGAWGCRSALGGNLGVASVLATAAATLVCLNTAGTASAAPEGIQKIQHVVTIMQENRSYDSYFGTYPGANGIPAGVCVPDPKFGGCVAPYHISKDRNVGGPHGHFSALNDINGGSMDGFVAQAEAGKDCSGNGEGCSQCNQPEAKAEACGEVMGYHDAREIPNYWSYAQNFVLQDNMFEPSTTASLISHNYMVSEWNANCPTGDANPIDCVNDVNGSTGTKSRTWTDVTYLLAKAHVSWRYYIYEGGEPDCESDEASSCEVAKQGPKTPGIWNPLASFTDVQEDGQRGNIQSLTHFYEAVHDQSGCGLPSVSWIDPKDAVSEHPDSLVSRGQAYVTTLINSIMRSPCWGSTAIFLSWDDWGGLYDHVIPPVIDANGYGLRVPGLLISPYAKAGLVDHQQLSHDAYLKFIEDDFLGGARLDPATDGRPDRRLAVREQAPGLGDLAGEFDFSQSPRPPVILSPHPEPGPASEPPGGPPIAPAVETVTASSLTRTSANLNATVNPNGKTVSDCHFEYGTSVFYESSQPCSSLPGSGRSPVQVSAAASGLIANTTYHFRVVATNESGTGYSLDGTFMTLPNPPEVTLVTPASGPEFGGAAVAIDGANLGGATAVKFGSTDAASFTIGSEGSITAVAPAGTGTVDISVTTSGGASTSVSADRFTYVPRPAVVKVSPGQGPVGGGTTTNITGSNFGGATAVKFGSSSATSFTVKSTTLITAVSPASRAGVVDVSVESSGGSSLPSANGQFTFRPIVSSLSPSAGSSAGGTKVTVTGTGFGLPAGSTTIRFGSTNATGVSCTATTTCTGFTRAHAVGAVDVKVTVATASSATTPGDQFTFY